MISTSEFRKGAKVEFKNAPYEIIDFQHVKMGRGGAIVRTKLRNLKTGSIIEETFKSGEKLKKPDLDERIRCRADCRRQILDRALKRWLEQHVAAGDLP